MGLVCTFLVLVRYCSNVAILILLYIRSFIKRSLSDGNILLENSLPVSNCNNGENTGLLPMQQLDDIREPSDSAPDISICEPNPCSRCVNPYTKLEATGKLVRSMNVI